MGRFPGCEGPWAAFSGGAVEAHNIIEYPKIKGDNTYVEAPWLWRPLGKYPDCPVLNQAMCVCVCGGGCVGGGVGGGGGGVCIQEPDNEGRDISSWVEANGEETLHSGNSA